MTQSVKSKSWKEIIYTHKKDPSPLNDGFKRADQQQKQKKRLTKGLKQAQSFLQKNLNGENKMVNSFEQLCKKKKKRLISFQNDLVFRNKKNLKKRNSFF